MIVDDYAAYACEPGVMLCCYVALTPGNTLWRFGTSFGRPMVLTARWNAACWHLRPIFIQVVWSASKKSQVSPQSLQMAQAKLHTLEPLG